MIHVKKVTGQGEVLAWLDEMERGIKKLPYKISFGAQLVVIPVEQLEVFKAAVHARLTIDAIDKGELMR